VKSGIPDGKLPVLAGSRPPSDVNPTVEMSARLSATPANVDEHQWVTT
jgi:hypothetical protein